MIPILFFLFLTAYAAALQEELDTVNLNFPCDVVTEKIFCLDSKIQSLLGHTSQITSDWMRKIESRILEIGKEIFPSTFSSSAITSFEGEHSETPEDNLFASDPSPSLWSKVIKLEKEFAIIKAKSSTPAVQGFREFLFEIESLKKSIKEAEERINSVEKIINKNRHHLGDEIKQDNGCIKEYDVTFFGKRQLIQYLQRVNFNIFLSKPVNTSSEYSGSYVAAYGIDGNFATRYSSKYENNPWLLIDLGVPHLISQMTFTTYAADRVKGIKIYVADRVTFDSYGHPQVQDMIVFAEYLGDVSTSLVTQFLHAGGVCGRYVVILRKMNGVDLSFFEFQAVGFSLM